MKTRHSRHIFACGVSTIAILACAPVCAQTGNGAEVSAAEPADGNTVVVVTARRRALENATEIKRRSDTVVDAVVADEAGKLPDTSITEVLQRVPGVTMSRFASNAAPDQFSHEGSGVQVRGLSGITTLLNGRESFSANGGAGLNFGDVTPELMSSVLVYKAGTSDIIEGGTGGTIDLRTHMPFDYKKPTVNISAEATYGDFSKEWTPSASILLSRRFDTPVGEFGALLDVAYARIRSDDSFVRVEPYQETLYQGNKVYAPGGFTWGNDQFDRNRQGYYAAFQWRPTDNLSFWQTTFISKYHTENRSEGVYPVNNASNTVVSGEFDENGVFIRGVMANRTPASGFAPGSGNSYVTSDNQTSDFSQGFDWRVSDRLQIKGALQVVDASVDGGKQGLGIGAPAFLQEYIDPTGDLPDVHFDTASLANTTDPARANIANIVWYEVDNRAHMGAANLDVAYSLDGFFTGVKAGVRFAKRRESDNFVGTGWSAAGRGWNGVTQGYVATSPAEDFMLYTFPNFFKGKAEAPTPYWFASESLLVPEQFAHVLDAYASCSPTGYRQCADPTATVNLYTDKNFGQIPQLIRTNTESQSFYAQANFEHSGEGMANFSGNFGVRVVKNKVSSTGSFTFTGGTTYYLSEEDAATSLAQMGGIDNVAQWQTDHPGEELPLTYTTVSSSGQREESFEYTRVLPAFNLAFKPEAAWVVRVALNQTMSPPSYNDIRALGTSGLNTIANPYATDTVYLPGIFNGYSYNSGNTHLKPAVSTNMDLSVEWYPSRSTNAHFNVFGKDIKDMIIYNDLDTVSGDLFGSAQPISTGANGSSGSNSGLVSGQGNFNASEISTIRGYEVGGRTYFDSLPGAFKGLGIEANYTRINSDSPSARARDMSGNPITDVPIVGLSKDNFNINILYDHDKWSARLAYNWRSRYLATTTGNGTTGSYALNGGATVAYSLPVYGAAMGQLDGSISYKVNERIQVGLNFTNIGDTISRTEMEILPGIYKTRSWFMTDRRVKLSVKASF